MDKSKMKSWYDPEVDIFYLALRPGSIDDSEEISSGIILEYNVKRQVLGIEIHNARQRVLEVIGEDIGSLLSKRIDELKARG